MKAISIIAVILAAGAGAAAYLYYHPQMIISGIQKMLYKEGRPINSFAPFAPPMRRVKENGQLYVTEIQYGTEYPNSYLDITYPKRLVFPVATFHMKNGEYYEIIIFNKWRFNKYFQKYRENHKATDSSLSMKS